MSKKLGFVSMTEGKINIIRNLSDEEYSKYKIAVDLLRRYSNDRRLFTMVIINFEEWKSLVHKYLLEYIENPSLDYFRMERIVLNLNRSILNYLSLVRTYLDHSEYNLKKRYGKESEKTNKFKEVCANEYNNYFSYRFLYKLRNYVQHCGMPISSFSLSSEVDKNDPNKVRHSIKASFKREEMLAHFDGWGSGLKEEIKKLPDSLEIDVFITEMMECLKRIDLQLSGNHLNECICNAEYIKNKFDIKREEPGAPCILNLNELSANGGNLGIEWIPIDLANMFLKGI